MKTYRSMLDRSRLFILVAVLAFILMTAGVTVFPEGKSATLITSITTPEAQGQYLVEFNGSRLPSNLSERVTALGGTIVDTLPEINVVVVANMTTSAAAFLATQPDVADVTYDEFIELGNSSWKTGAVSRPFGAAPTAVADPMSAIFFPFQWDKRAIRADRAWQAGFLGSPDVRLAVIDTGIDPTHPELVELIDASRSISFVTEETPIVQQEFPGYPAWTDLHGHGTFTAAIASSNSNLLAGVTSHTTLMAIKALGLVPSRASNITRGIIYAANHGADVINISAVSSSPFSRARSRHFFHYEHLAVQYALVKGVSAVVVAA